MIRIRTLALLAGLAPLTAAAQATPAAPTRVAESRGAIASAADAPRDSAIARLEEFLGDYPNSPLRPSALLQLGELLVREADEAFANAQRAAGGGDTTRASDAPIRPNYGPAIARYEELVRRFPNFDRIDAAAYTLGTLYAGEQRYADAARVFEMVVANDSSRFRPEAFFRLGDARFELAAKARGEQRRALFARAAEAYEQSTAIAPRDGDIYFLALYKLGWSYYNQATQTNQESYRRAVEIFGQLVDAYDRLSPEQQARLGLRGEAIEYMAVAFTQVGGAEAANRYFAQRGGSTYRLPILRRVAESLRDQGSFPEAVAAYRVVLAEAPTDSSTLAAQREIIDIYQNRLLAADSAQAARLALVENFGPNSAWAQANPGLRDTAQAARELALRESGLYVLAGAQRANDRARFAQAAQLYERYFTEFASSDSAQRVSLLQGEAYFGLGNFTAAGSAYSRAAYGFGQRNALADSAGLNAVVAFDSALVRARGEQAAQDSLFAAVDRYVEAFPQTENARRALRQKGLRASEGQRWDVMAATFRTYAERFPNDPYTPTAQKLVGDALYRSGQYAEAEVQWQRALEVARAGGRRALADTITRTRTAAAATFADTLIRRGEFARAAEEVYLPIADRDPQGERAAGALRDAIETYLIAADSADSDEERRRARERAVELSNRLVAQHPTYRYRLQYQARAATLLADLGRNEEAVQALQRLVDENPRWEGRADAMVRLATALDTLGRKAEAATAYARFADAFPRDPRAADALYNAAATYEQAGDYLGASRTYARFAQRFPRDERAARARQLQVGALQQSGDSTAANTEIARLCAAGGGGEALRGVCAERSAERAFEQGRATFETYRGETLRIGAVGQLNQAGVRRASQRKQQLLRQLTQQFTRAIETGNPRYLAASTYYIGLAQWEYGRFLENVELPAGLSDEQREQALAGARNQAQEFYNQARATWQALIEKAGAEEALANDPGAREWLDRARQAAEGNVPTETGASASAAGAEGRNG
jgi:tetratricopeptide (TPR) repeat protein